MNRYNKLKSIVPDKLWVIQDYFRRFGRIPNLKNPRTFNEKLLWLKLNYKDPLLPQLVHKADVREYVRSKVGAAVLNELYGVFSKTNGIQWESLPQQYVVKACHASGWNRIVRSADDTKGLSEEIDEWLSQDYGRRTREWPYSHCTKAVLFEKLLHGPDGNAPWDYKIFCFNGVARLIQVDIDRFERHVRAIMDLEWELCECNYQYPKPAFIPKRPRHFDQMVTLAERLAGPLPFCRIDLYDLPEGIIFGEITCYPENGTGRIAPASFDGEWGRWIDLPAKR